MEEKVARTTSNQNPTHKGKVRAPPRGEGGGATQVWSVNSKVKVHTKARALYAFVW